MDYDLAALKLFCSQLRHAQQTETPSASTAVSLYGILFQRAWIQGVLVIASSPKEEGGGVVLLDDGTGIIELLLTDVVHDQEWKSGMYVMAVGNFMIQDTGDSQLKVHKIVDLSACPDRESMWYLEVIEAYKLFYEASYKD